MSTKAILSIGVPVIMQLLQYAAEMRQILGPDVTDEQIARAWEAGAARYAVASDAWREA